MKKCAIITLTGYNFGNRLQNYATQEILKKFDYDVYTIHNPYMENYNKYKHFTKLMIKSIFDEKSRKDLSREKKFELFDKENINYSNLYLSKPKDIDKMKNIFYFFACGSDQVWNPMDKKYGYNNFAMFTKNKITMAPSFGVDVFPQNRVKEFNTYLNSFDYLSAREKSGVEIIKNISGKTAECVIDPTLMLSKDEWISLQKKPHFIKDDNYILVYCLGNNNFSKEISEFSKKENLKIIDIMNYKNKGYCIGPSEFIYLVNNAKYIITDSFHGSIFSLLFEKKFAIFERKDKFDSMNTRIENLIELFMINDRLLKPNYNLENILNSEIDYKKIKNIIRNEIIHAMNYIKKSINNIENKRGD